MTQEGVFKRIVDILERLKISYMLTGAAAVSFWGKPRSTHDLDVVVLVKEKDIENLAESLGESFFLDKDGAKEAIKTNQMFNLLHLKSGIKIDCWPQKGDVYSRSCFQRRRRENFLGRKAWLISPEDLIIVKLLWFKRSGMQKHLEDARGILEIQKGRLDLNYLQKWAARQKVEKFLAELI